MNSAVSGLRPASVFQYFEDICKIPHGSKNTKAISDYCVTFAIEHNLTYIQDASNNVIIFKNGSVGYENHHAVILQGHLDMVNEKTPDSTHDFSNDALELVLESDFLRCKDTTLGGDDGIAVAFALAILDDDSLQHPPLEVVLTVDEEIGLLGAQALDVTPLHGTSMLNLDSEEEGIFLAGCAGGVTADITFPLDRITIGGIACQLTISGLNGGHSGTEIDKGYANAHKILGRLLYALKSNDIYFGISSIAGGSKDNVIPSLCQMMLVFPDASNMELAQQLIQKLVLELKVEYQVADSNIQITLVPSADYVSGVSGISDGSDGSDSSVISSVSDVTQVSIMSLKSTEILTFFLMHAPNGIQYMNQSIKGLVETSLNMGILYTSDESVHIGFSVRSSVKSAKIQLMNQLAYMTEFLGGDCSFNGEYPSWAYKTDSLLRDLFAKTYQELYQKEAIIETIHAGLECGIFAEKFELQGKPLDIIAFGPDIFDIHSVKEKLSISSVLRVWNFLIEILKKL